ncbi:hypothetical protein QFC22_002185 [Naganishia vaughanmartiniae]|uniref:Uncharacterized protein n=1 Tax=Naganishia vaughanmartiniae TaxID=1424756 RepID=A0ACC2XD57_9TREE|nr:hypothetical protein QFC22_002185 [Naganishia vaughanmartiniae]
MSEQTTPKIDEGRAVDPATTAGNEVASDFAGAPENRAAKEGIDDTGDGDAGKALETAITESLVEASLSEPPPLAPVASIPSLLRLHPGFSSRKVDQSIGRPSGWRVSCSRGPDSPVGQGSWPGIAKGASGILRMPMSAIGIGFGENERLKHTRFRISPQVIRDIRPRKYLPPARRGSGAGDEAEVTERRSSLNDSTHRRMLASSFGTTKQVRTARSGTPVPVEFPETTFIGPGRLPTFEEQKLIRLARGTAIATVKTVIAPAADGSQEKHSTGPSRSLVSIEREDRREEPTKDASEQNGSALPVPPTAKSLAGGNPIPRTDIILCKFYHTPGLKCTASPCRFIHEINRSALLSSTAGTSHAKSLSAASDNAGPTQEEGADGAEEPVEIVEVFRMSGGGKGAGSLFAKAKFKTVTCRDFAAGYCFYGDFCSFKHEMPGEPDNNELSKGLVTKGQPETNTGESVMSNLEAETSTKDTADGSEAIAPLSPRQSTCTIVAPQTNPSIMLEDRPLTWSREGTPLPNGSKAIKFKSSNIIVPDYRWTNEQGMVASPSATALEFSQALQDMKKLASSSVTLPIWSSGKPNGNSLSWADAISPKTIVTPVQYANAPPMDTWRKIQPLQKDHLNTGGNRAHQSSGTSSAQDESPLLPITAYSFSTDSSPPETPATQQQEVVTPENQHVDLPAVHILHDTVAQPGGEHQSVEAWRSQEHFAHMNSLAAGHHDDMYAATSVYPWVVEAFLQQMDPAPINAMWLDDPLSSGYGPVMSKHQFARQLAKQAKLGDLPPQVPQNKTNYRSAFMFPTIL